MSILPKQYMTEQLAEFALATKFEDLPQTVVHAAKRMLLDSIGCIVDGTIASERGKGAAVLAKRLGGPPESSIIGTSDKVSCANAAFVSGDTTYATNFDCVHPEFAHVNPAVVSTSLAVGEMRSVSGKELLLAFVVGEEIGLRVGAGLEELSGIPRSQLVHQAYRKTAKGKQEGSSPHTVIIGDSPAIFGCVASAGKMLTMSNSKMASAMGIAGYNAPMPARGHWHSSGPSVDAGAALLRGFSPGWISHTGIAATLLAETGYTGNMTVLDGEAGFWRFTGAAGWNPKAVTDKIGKEWHLLGTCFKLYPGCGVIHSALDAFKSIVDENHLTPDETEQVKGWVSPHFLRPLCANRDPSNEVHSQFSAPYIFALLAHRIPPGIEWRSPANMKSPKLRAFMEKVTFDLYDKSAPGAKAARDHAKIDVVARGKKYHAERKYRMGAAVPKEAQMSDKDLEEKFRRNMAVIMPKDKADKVVKTIWELEKVKDVSKLIQKLHK
jgi:2-methylcitrate dehydratase PrpD